MTFRMVPPAGVPVKPGEILRLLSARLTPAKSAVEIKRIIGEIAGVRHLYFVNSGRAANYIILKTLKSLSANYKNEIIIPAYTCYSVPASIVRAGLKIRPIDIEPDTLDYNYDNLRAADISNTLAILPSNLFGIVSDWRQIKNAITGHEIFTIDDSAQTLGLPADNRVSGAMGDIGFYSLGRGKNMTTYSGGIILTDRDDLAHLIEAEMAALAEPSIAGEMVTFAKILLYGTFLNPNIYWLPNSLPFLQLGHTAYDEDFEIAKFSSLQYCFGPIMFSKLDAVNNIRCRNSEIIIGRVSELGKYRIPGSLKSKIPYIRLPLLAPDRNTRDKIVNMLGRCGIVSSGMYPSTVAQIPQIREHLACNDCPFEGAKTAVDCLFTLPTHPYVTGRDIDKMISCLKSI